MDIIEHDEKIKNGICPLCGSSEGFEHIVIGEGEYAIDGYFCVSCGTEIN